MLEVITIAIAVAPVHARHCRGAFAINRDYFFKVSIYDKGMDICSGEDFDKSGPKYKWLHEREVKSYFRYLEWK